MPPSAISRRSLCCPMTISAPVFVSDISRQAVTIGTTLVCTASSPVEKMRVMKLKCFWRMPIICRKRRSSGWKTMIQRNGSDRNQLSQNCGEQFHVERPHDDP